MITISPEQMQALAAPTVTAIRTRILAHLQRFWPEEYARLGEGQAARALDWLIDEARRHDIVFEDDLRRCADLAFALEDFGYFRHAWAREILLDQDYPPPVKVKLLWRAVRSQLVDQAASTPPMAAGR